MVNWGPGARRQWHIGGAHGARSAAPPELLRRACARRLNPGDRRNHAVVPCFARSWSRSNGQDASRRSVASVGAGATGIVVGDEVRGGEFSGDDANGDVAHSSSI